MFRSHLSRLRLLALGLLAGGLVVFWYTHPVLAQVDQQAFTQFGEQAGLATGTDLRVVIARIIRVVLGFVGIILLGFILYGGFVWMTAGGNPERVKTAKRIFVNAAIGMVIVLSSFAITQFILSTFLTATGVGVGTGGAEDGYDDGSFGSGTVFTLNSINTACAASVRNFQVQMVFSQPVSEASVRAGGIAVYNASGKDVPGSYEVEGNNVYFTPSASCGPESGNATCFEANTEHKIKVGAGLLRSTRNTALVCSIAHPCEFSFVSGSAIDLKSPSVDLSTPEDGASIVTNTIELLQAHVLDDVGGSSVAFSVDGHPVFTAGLELSTTGSVSPDTYFSTDESEWNTAGTVGGRSYRLTAEGRDCAGNVTLSPNVTVMVREAHCGNGVMDADLGETGADCGGDASSTSYCGACEGSSCETTADCALGSICDAGQCTSVTQISAVSPGDGAPGNLLTISGTGFGDAPGTVRFLGGTTAVSSPYVCDGVTKWSDTEIIVAVPQDARDGAIEVLTSSGKTDATNDETGPFIRDFDVNAVVRPGLCSVTPNPLLPQGEMTLKGFAFGDTRGTSTVYLGASAASAYLGWTNTLLNAVVPNAHAGVYRAQVFTGNYVCVAPDGRAGNACKIDADCNAKTNETCRTFACSENLSRFCSTDADCGTDGGSCVSLRQGSNPVYAAVSGLAESNPPNISYVDTGWSACSDGTACALEGKCADGSVCAAAPNWGPSGQYVTIFGSGFGTSLGTVRFTNTRGGALDSVQAIGSTDVPDACENLLWNDDSITIKVPSDYLSGQALEFGSHTITVIRGEDGLASNATSFEVVSGTPGPSLCAIDPSVGPEEVEVTLFGEGFGERMNLSKTVFSDTLVATVVSWIGEEIKAVVPSRAVSGPVYVSNSAGMRSNPVTFTIGDCRENKNLCLEGTACCADGSCRASCDVLTPKTAHYAWRFSTGIIPEAPRVLAYCGDADGDGNKDGASPSPWNAWSASGVCVNAAVSATFSIPMDPATLTSDTILVERCDNADCTQTTPVRLDKMDVSATSFLWSPAAPFEAGKSYRATILGGTGPVAARSLGGEPLPQDYSWMFSVAASGDTCTIGSVYVSPTNYTEKVQNEKIGYLAAPLAKNDACVTLACSGVAWTWSSTDNGARLEEARVSGACTNSVTAAEETSPGIPARIQAVAESPGSPSDFGLLTVDFTDPEIIGFAPNCDGACVNADVLVTFNSPMMAQDLTPSNVHLYRCEDATCADGLTAVSLRANNLTYVYVPGAATSTLEINPPDFSPGTNYRLIVSGSVRSTSGVALSRAHSDCTQAGDSCQFKTKSDATPCAIERISVNPPSPRASYVGEYVPFYATAYGAPDSCAASGQPLDPSSYDWSAWTASDTPDADGYAVVATMLPSAHPGSLALSSELADGCTPACLHAGSPASIAIGICGNGRTEVGEDCDDHNAVSGDGCSEMCVREGREGTYGNCGNNIVERDVASGAGEDCDGGTGCTTLCTNRGTSGIGGTASCGDGVVDYAPTTGGEDCDDGNRRDFDGCSSSCVNEGTIPQFLAYAVCGDGHLDPGEDCDDSNLVSGDGCTNVCLREGRAGSSVCGNGGIEREMSGAGEDCDDGNTTSGDGCSAQCTSEGSSVSYRPTPSVCGDGSVGVGEECDARAQGQFAVGPFGVARISPTAPAEVDAETGYAISTIAAEAAGVGGEATLSLSCSCNTDMSCGDAALGCGSGSCCFERPTLQAHYPAAAATNQCRNTAVWVQFSEAMDKDSFADANGRPSLFLELSSIGGVPVTPTSCPAAYTELASAKSSSNVFARAWGWVARTLFGTEANAAPYACVTPVSYEEEDAGNGSVRVRLLLSDLLVANGTYRLRIQGDPNTQDAERVGILSANGVSLRADAVSEGLILMSPFTVGQDLCVLNAVTAKDTGRVESLTDPIEAASVGFFTRTEETHRLQAVGYAVRGGEPQEIYPINGIYAWDWSWGSNKADAEEGNIITTTESSTVSKEADARAVGQSGQESAIAIATITADSANNPSTVNTTVSGSASMEALLCEHPWPDLGAYPYTEDATNFSFSYCRDAGAPGLEGDLPALRVVEVPSPSTGILTEFLYELEGTPDALGVRVVSDPEYLPPDVWYRTQGFRGSLTETEVDGYPAVRDGNTVYVLAANEAGDIYPNIYVISSNTDASPEAEQVFDEVLSTFRFNANTDVVTDVNVCRTPSGYVSDDAGVLKTCASDLECSEGAVCDAEKAKLRRDTVRLSDLARLQQSVEAYGDAHGTCSVSGAACKADAECPGTETCEASVPTIDAGSFYRGTSVSAWPSWTAVLGNALGSALPSDPLNALRFCPEGSDEATCWNVSSSRFSCPVGSHVYTYQSVGGRAFRAYAELEYDGAPWAYDIDTSASDLAELHAEYADYRGGGRAGTGTLARGFSADPLFCDGATRGDSSACGDGVVGAGEACEPGDTFTQSCTKDGHAGFQTYACTQDCQNNPSAAGALLGACTPFSCGNGVIEPLNGEACDDGVALNGTYGHCSVDCGVSTFSCGDGYLAGSEECDCGTTQGFTSIKADHNSWAFLNGCAVANGQYTTGTGTSCAYDCKAPGPSCGDGEVTFTESCDGNYEAWDGALCSDGTACTTNADCAGGTCGAGGARCGSDNICLGGTSAGTTCSLDTDCPGGTCSDADYPLARNRTCKEPGNANACSWNSWTSCVGGGQFCGNGKVEGGEACDDGNGSNNDACTNQCVPNVCGDNLVNVGVESCDAGSANGEACTADYGGTCSACSATCQYLTSTGSFCGDGVINDGEMCDSAAVNYTCFDNSGNGRTTGGSCLPAMANLQGSCEAGFTCRQVGVCNGGSFNGQACTRDSGTDWTTQAISDAASCGATGDGACVFPVCAPNCGSTCPTPGSTVGMQTASLTAQTEEAGAVARDQVELFSYLSGFTPDNAVVFIPACSAATQITADISMNDVIPPSVDIVFVTDLSGSMAWGVDGTVTVPEGQRRIDYVMDSTESAIRELLDAYAGNNGRMRISLVSFHGTTNDSPAYNDRIEIDHTFTDNKNELIQEVRTYGALIAGGTPTVFGVDAAISLLEDSDADRKIIILLSDGEPTVIRSGAGCNGAQNCVSEISTTINALSGIDVYSAAIASDASLIGYMAHMSSDACGSAWSLATDCHPRDGVEYAHQADQAEEISAMYTSIIDAVLGASAAVTSNVRGVATVTTGSVREGGDVPLPFPLGFSCTGSSFTIPLSVAFGGTGKMRLSNFALTYCPVN